MKKFLAQFLFLIFFCTYLLRIDNIKALVPYYYLPTIKNLEKESLSLGKNAYQLLFFGQLKESLSLAKLAVQINKSDEKLWLILSETQIANKLYKDALISLKKAQKINPNISEIYFAQSSIHLKQSDLNKAKTALKKVLEIEPNNHRAIFQLGNIFLMQKNYSSAIKLFERAVEIKPAFWQAINNQGLAYFELDKINLSKKLFERAILIEKNAEPLLGLAICLRIKDIDSALELAKEALKKNPKYFEFDYRKEQLWGNKLQTSTEQFLKNEELLIDVISSKSKIK